MKPDTIMARSLSALRFTGDAAQLDLFREIYTRMPGAFPELSCESAVQAMAARLREQNAIGNACILARLLGRGGHRCDVGICPKTNHLSVALPAVAAAVGEAIRRRPAREGSLYLQAE